MSLGKKLKSKLAEIGMNQKELAEKLNISQSTLNGYFNDYREPDFNTLNNLARVLDCSVDYLISGYEAPAWYAGTLQNGTTTDENNPFRYCKTGNRVDIAGLLYPNAIYAVTFTRLPAGFRPEKPLGFTASAASANVFITRCCQILDEGSCVLHPTDRAGTELVPFWINFSFIAEK